MWSLPRRIAFRFGALVAAGVILPFPLDMIPKVDWLAEQYARPWAWATGRLADLLGVEDVVQETGSGDTMHAWVHLLLVAIVAAVGAAIWSVLDRRRTEYRRLAHWVWVGLRYWLGFSLLSYGFIKFIDGQFVPPGPLRLDQRVGTMSPMGMLWTFMGSSMPYTMFAGAGELLGGALLLWRRTATLGALVAAGVMTNVVALNFCYDVPVKMYSSELLLAAIAVASPALPGLLRAALGRSVPEVPPRPRPRLRWYRAGRALKVILVGCALYGFYDEYEMLAEYHLAPGPLEGMWRVETFAYDGAVRPPLTTDEVRWSRVAFEGKYIVAISMTEQRAGFEATLDERAHTIAAVERGRDDAPPVTWTYERPAPDELRLAGTRAGKPFTATLKRAPPSLLVTRGFHWVTEQPYNR